MKNHLMSLQIFSKDEWLDRVERKSESKGSRQVAETSLSMFDYFCKDEGVKQEEKIDSYLTCQKDGNIDSIYQDLDKFIQFLDEDHEDIILNKDLIPLTFKKKNPRTIITYFGFIKSYLRICYRIKLHSDDIKDFIQFPKIRKTQRKAVSIQVLKTVFNNASPRQRALYYVLVSSGMRLGEALALTPKDFHMDENPVRITIDAEITKTKESRETYISSEAVEKVKPYWEKTNDNEKVLCKYDRIKYAVEHEDRLFRALCKRLKLVEKYPNSPRNVVNIHAFRAYFHTKASQKHGVEYANALDGHGAYLKQYYRETDEERAKKYKELEPSLFIESIKLETEKTKDKTIEILQAQIQKMQDRMERIELLNKE